MDFLKWFLLLWLPALLKPLKAFSLLWKTIIVVDSGAENRAATRESVGEGKYFAHSCPALTSLSISNLYTPLRTPRLQSTVLSPGKACIHPLMSSLYNNLMLPEMIPEQVSTIKNQVWRHLGAEFIQNGRCVKKQNTYRHVRCDFSAVWSVGLVRF